MSFVAAKAAVVAAAVAVLDGAVTVLPFDPPAITGETVTISTAGLSPTELRLAVRIWVPAIQSQEGQDRLDELTELVDTADFPAPRSDWDLIFDQVKEAFYMQSVVEFPRGDF